MKQYNINSTTIEVTSKLIADFLNDYFSSDDRQSEFDVEEPLLFEILENDFLNDSQKTDIFLKFQQSNKHSKYKI